MFHLYFDNLVSYALFELENLELRKKWKLIIAYLFKGGRCQSWWGLYNDNWPASS